jgi:hypothetical protein
MQTEFENTLHAYILGWFATLRRQLDMFATVIKPPHFIYFSFTSGFDAMTTYETVSLHLCNNVGILEQVSSLLVT